MSVIDIDSKLGKVKNRLAFIGIELEGGWKSPDPVMRIIRDGSVFAEGFPKGFNQSAGHRHGEFPSDILEPAAVARWIRKYYPDFHDTTCGLHIHMSFRDAKHYESLMSMEYQDTLLHYLMIWGAKNAIPDSHHFWERVKGQNRFCKKEFWPRPTSSRPQQGLQP
jgi:hypothetical protein